MKHVQLGSVSVGRATVTTIDCECSAKDQEQGSRGGGRKLALQWQSAVHQWPRSRDGLRQCLVRGGGFFLRPVIANGRRSSPSQAANSGSKLVKQIK